MPVPPPLPPGSVARPTIPTGRELYDIIMVEIEPELTTANLETLEDRYKGESSDEFAKRKERYALAMERYQQAYQDYIETLQVQVERYRKATFEKVEIEDRTNEQGVLDHLSSIFAAA